MTKTSASASASATVVYTDASLDVVARIRATETLREREDRILHERESARAARLNSAAGRALARLALSVRVEGVLHTRDEHAGPQSSVWWEGTVAELLEEVSHGTGCGCCSTSFCGEDATDAPVFAGSRMCLYDRHERAVAYETACGTAYGTAYGVSCAYVTAYVGAFAELGKELWEVTT